MSEIFHDNPVADETHQLSYDLTRWYGNVERKTTEPIPPPSPMMLQRLGYLLADDYETGFLEHIGRLATVKDDSLRQALFLYACGYSSEDIEAATGVGQGHVTNVMEQWGVHSQNKGLGRKVLSEVMIASEPDEARFQRKLHNVKAEWRKSLPERSNGAWRIFDGMPGLIIPNLSFIDSETEAALTSIVAMVYDQDYPDQSKGDRGELSRFFVQVAVHNHGERKGADEANCPKYVAHNFLYGEWGALLLARHPDIFYQAFQDLSEGLVPELPSKEALTANHAIDAVLDIINDPFLERSNENKSKYGISQPLVSLLEKADLSHESMVKLRGLTREGRQTVAYRLLEFFQQHGVFVDDAARHVGRMLLAQQSLSVDEINDIVSEDRRSTASTFYDETAELFSDRPAEVQAIFDNLPTYYENYRVVQGSVQTVFKEVLPANTIERFATLRSGQITLLSHRLEGIYRKGLRRRVSSGGDIAKRHLQVLDLALNGKEYNEIVELISPPFSLSTISDTIVGRNLPVGFGKYKQEVVDVVNSILDLTPEQERELLRARDEAIMGSVAAANSIEESVASELVIPESLPAKEQKPEKVDLGLEDVYAQAVNLKYRQLRAQGFSEPMVERAMITFTAKLDMLNTNQIIGEIESLQYRLGRTKSLKLNERPGIKRSGAVVEVDGVRLVYQPRNGS